MFKFLPRLRAIYEALKRSDHRRLEQGNPWCFGVVAHWWLIFYCWMEVLLWIRLGLSIISNDSGCLTHMDIGKPARYKSFHAEPWWEIRQSIISGGTLDWICEPIANRSVILRYILKTSRHTFQVSLVRLEHQPAHISYSLSKYRRIHRDYQFAWDWQSAVTHQEFLAKLEHSPGCRQIRPDSLHRLPKQRRHSD